MQVLVIHEDLTDELKTYDICDDCNKSEGGNIHRTTEECLEPQVGRPCSDPSAHHEFR
jgi:hypothetical protein